MALTSPASFNMNGPPSSSKRRRRTSPEALAALELAYAECPLPDKATRNELGDRIGWDCRAVQVWFQNRRQREKREKETEAYYARATSGVLNPNSNKENALDYAPTTRRSSAAGPLRSSPLPRAVPQPYVVRTPAMTMMLPPPPPPPPQPFSHQLTPLNSRPEVPASEVWRLMASSPERSADALSSSPVKADVRPSSLVKRTLSLDVLASRSQQVFGHLAAGSSSPNVAQSTMSHSPEVPSLSYSMAEESSDAGSSETDDLVTPDTTSFTEGENTNKVVLDDRDRECANLLMQLCGARA